MIHGMHVRWDWDRWIDNHNGVTVRALCGARTKVHLAGIPGMTLQNISVPVKGKVKFGWCLRCMYTFSYELGEWFAVEKEYTSDIVIPCYVSSIMVTKSHQSVIRRGDLWYGNPSLPDPAAEQWLKSDK